MGRTSTVTVTRTGDAGTGGFKVYELFKHDWDGTMTFSLFFNPLSGVQCVHDIKGGWVVIAFCSHLILVYL